MQPQPGKASVTLEADSDSVLPSDDLAQQSRLAKQARAGDTTAFGELVRRLQPPVYRLCRRYLGPTEAEDIAQEVFLRAFVHQARFDPSRPLLPWLLTIARRLCIDRLRRTAIRCEQPQFEEHLQISATAESHLASKEQLEKLRRAVGELALGPREAFLLFHLEGLAYREIATVLEVPIGTVMTWLHRARSFVREHVMAEEAQLEPRSARVGGSP